MVHGIVILASNPLVAHSIQLLVIFPLTCPTYPYRNPMKSLEIGMSYPKSRQVASRCHQVAMAGKSAMAVICRTYVYRYFLCVYNFV
jgi:hypothetical protein